tara:strand:+ start:405 stop:824 length:420 start_codon:yes stop_codon:yes gene_type:complete
MSEISNIILDLEIIKQIKEKDKLALIVMDGSKKLFVDSYSTLSSLSRWYHGYNRENSIEYLQELVLKIENINKFLVDGNHSNSGLLLKKTIESALTGLTNLKDTYIDDSITTAKLTIIINKLNTEIESLKKFETETNMY